MPDQPTKAESWKRAIYALFSLGVTVGIFSYLLRNVDLHEVGQIGNAGAFSSLEAKRIGDQREGLVEPLAVAGICTFHSHGRNLERTAGDDKWARVDPPPWID